MAAEIDELVETNHICYKYCIFNRVSKIYKCFEIRVEENVFCSKGYVKSNWSRQKVVEHIFHASINEAKACWSQSVLEHPGLQSEFKASQGYSYRDADL